MIKILGEEIIKLRRENNKLLEEGIKKKLGEELVWRKAFLPSSPVNLEVLEAQHQTNCKRIVFNAI